MDDSDPWSDNPYAPKGIPYPLYLQEKANFAGFLIGSILYGIVVTLFFQCMVALFDSVHRRGEGIEWGVVSYTVIMFSFATVFTTTNLHIQSLSYIDNREYHKGPLYYQVNFSRNALNIIPTLMFLLNNWLADGFLLYRCYVIYGKRLWVIAFPCLIYLGSFAVGFVALKYQALGWGSPWAPVPTIFGPPCLSISLTLNSLLTIMIVVWLSLHIRNVRAAMGSPAGFGGLYSTIITMILESFALHAVASLLAIVSARTYPKSLLLNQPYAAIEDISYQILAQTQVIAPLFIVQRVANKNALTGGAIVAGNISSLNFRSRGRSTGGGTLPGARPTGSMDDRGTDPGESEAEAEIMTVPR